MTKWIDGVNLPSQTGFYWARTSGHRWWNLIVNVRGDAPFFCIDMWEYTHDKLVVLGSVYDIVEFGPRIEDAPKIEGKREDWH